MDRLRGEEGYRKVTWLMIAGGFCAAVVALFFGVIWLAERKAKAELKEKQDEEALRKLQKAVEADVRGIERIARGELLADDGHRRD